MAKSQLLSCARVRFIALGTPHATMQGMFSLFSDYQPESFFDEMFVSDEQTRPHY
jgi:hypothetical protein